MINEITKDIEEVPYIPYDERNNDYCQWLNINGSTYVPSLHIEACKKMPAGVYGIKWDHKYSEYVFFRKEINIDELFVLPDEVFDTIINDIKYFWDNKKLFDKYNYTYKRGILLYGTPGCGKTSICSLLSKMVIDYDGIVLSINNGEDLYNYYQALPQLRKIEKTTPILCIIEDLDGLTKDTDTETKLLNLLDGINQINNIVYVGNTNYPENLKDRITNRPSRFDKRYEIGLPNADVRRFYLKKKISQDDIESVNIDDIIHKTEGFSIAHLGELIKSIFIFNKDIDESIEEIKNMGKFVSSSQFNKGRKSGVGFNGK